MPSCTTASVVQLGMVAAALMLAQHVSKSKATHRSLVASAANHGAFLVCPCPIDDAAATGQGRGQRLANKKEESKVIKDPEE